MAVYVMSDLHGQYNRYCTIMKQLQLKEDDTLYILGDVIDRGEYGIKILLDIQQRKNVIMMMGNHEHMMLEYMQAMKLDVKTAKDQIIISRWNRNHNEPTLHEFSQLKVQEQDDLIGYLAQLPLAFPNVQVNDKRFYLVHAYPYPAFQEERIDLTICAQYNVEARELLWERIQGSEKFFNDRQVILGHTPTYFFQECHPYTIWHQQLPIESAALINIDCGCAIDSQDTRLACLRLDDYEVFYA